MSDFGKSFAIRKNLVDVRGFEPLTPCLQSVNWLAATDYNGLLSCCVLFVFRPVDRLLNYYSMRWFLIEVCTKLCTNSPNPTTKAFPPLALVSLVLVPRLDAAAAGHRPYQRSGSRCEK
jgi:hypothetical protein